MPQQADSSRRKRVRKMPEDDQDDQDDQGSKADPDQQDLQPPLLSLPEEVLLIVIRSLRTCGLESVAGTCKELRRLVLLQSERLTVRIDKNAYKQGRLSVTAQLLSAIQRPSGSFTLRLRLRAPKHSVSVPMKQQHQNLGNVLHTLGRCPAVAKLELRNAFGRCAWSEEASQQLAASLPNSTSLDFARFSLRLSLLMPLIEKHTSISVRGSCLSLEGDTASSSRLFPSILSQPGLVQLHLSGQHPRQCRLGHAGIRDFLPAAAGVQSATLTQLCIGRGQYCTTSIQPWTPLLSGFPSLHTLTLHLNHSYSTEPIDTPEHWKAFLASCPLVHTLSLPSVSVTDKETLNTLLSHKPLRYLKVWRIQFEEDVGTSKCPVPEALQQLEVVWNLDLEALAHLPGAVVAALAGHPFQVDLAMGGLIDDFDTEAGVEQLDMAPLEQAVSQLAAHLKRGGVGPWCKLLLDVSDLADETTPSALPLLSRWRLDVFRRLAPLCEAGLGRLELLGEAVSREEVAALGQVLGSSLTHLYVSECQWVRGFKFKHLKAAIAAAFPHVWRLVLDMDDESDTEDFESFRLGEPSDSDSDDDYVFCGHSGGSSDEDDDEGEDVGGSSFVTWAGGDL